ncbi:MAG: HAMP domain-containing histidine kinase [Sphingomonas sp.]|uniref:sensor histidine kinase n=1 Tax=Sphingomonas sp. TaxID=28214 RepID=UPI001AC85900|nr:HAMP domain-containing sensor histidine kinase [Sphingomonas sp.]MBN8807453.1 HAMP domain-containing histidine kinase [Sphingomonas sp.]
MRFDDSLDTVLAADASTPFGAQSAWRQLTDLIARRRVDSAAAIERLRAIRSQIPAGVRSASARSVAFGDPPLALVALFAEDSPAIAAPVIAVARLSEAEWLSLIPGLSPTSRGLLRHRRDLPASVGRALDSYGAVDFALPQPEGVTIDLTPTLPAEPANDVEVEPTGAFAIADLVARIDAYQRDHGDLDRGPSALAAAQPIGHFCFETDERGMIRWVDGAPREPLIGVVLGGIGARTDGVVAGAFRHRASFADARLVVPGVSAAAGDWQISATPGFDPANGRFTGYRGVARRPRSDERAGPIPPAAEALRALVHELRTPTNAISGFAEMIEGQVLGPAPAVYRERAGIIRTNTRDLLNAIDDVDTVARIEQGALELRPDTVAVGPLLARLAGDLEPLLRLRGATLDVDDGTEPLAVHGDTIAVSRIVSRLLSLSVGACARGERLAVDAGIDGEAVTIAIDRPRAFLGRSEDELLSSSASEPDDGTTLGVGFALRLARNLASELGGGLAIGGERLTLRLPAALDREVGQLSSI